MIITKYGKACLEKGYYRIYEGNNKNKYVHRLVWEETHGEIPEGYHIHHKDSNPLNNDISNLELLSASEHHRKHRLENHHFKDKTLSEEHKYKICSALNQTGIRGVSKETAKTAKQGFVWRYDRVVDGKRIRIKRTKLENLEKVVKERNLPWDIIN